MITMSISAKKSYQRVSFGDFSEGINLSKDSTQIGNKQVQDASNAILRESGAYSRPGTLAKSSFDLTGLIKGLHNYIQLDETEHLLAGSAGKLYSLNKSTGASTELYDLTGTGKFKFTDALDKCWITNGTEVVKNEGGTVYPVGIEAPSGASAAAQAGGSLADGDYEVYAGYGRDVGGTIVLYSQAEYLGTVTLGSGNNTVRVTSFAQSSDTQVNKRVIWMSDAGGSTIYQYYTAANDATTTHDVTSNASRSGSLIYSVLAANNASCPEFSDILAQDGRLWGVSVTFPNRVYYSLRNTSNVYDLERWFPLNFIDFPYEVTGIFALGINLYVNTPVGIFVQPNSDVTARYIYIEKRWTFKYMSTVVDHNGGKLGLTNDGVKFFDGEKFLDYDITEAVKGEISKIYNSTSGFDPEGVIIRRDIRTEYHLSYNDDSLTSVTNNKRLVLNLDMLAYLPEKKVIAPWEIWFNGATHMVGDLSGTTYQIQSHATAPKLYIETTLNTADNGTYLKDGTIGTATSYFKVEVCTKTMLLDMSARVAWETLRVMARLNESCRFEVHIRDVEGLLSNDAIGSGEGNSLWDVFLWDVGTWASSAPVLQKKKLPMNLHGYMMFVQFYQTANDPDFNILKIDVDGVATISRLT